MRRRRRGFYELPSTNCEAALASAISERFGGVIDRDADRIANFALGWLFERKIISADGLAAELADAS